MALRGQNYHLKQGFKQVGQWGFNRDRLWSKIDKTPDQNGCLNWQGAMSPSGALMGAWKNNRQQMTQARRLVWMSINNKDVSEHRVTLSCDNQSCCNPEHFVIKANLRRDML